MRGGAVKEGEEGLDLDRHRLNECLKPIVIRSLAYPIRCRVLLMTSVSNLF